MLRPRTRVLIVCTDFVTIGFAVCRIIGPIDTIRPALFVHYALITHPSIRTHREKSAPIIPLNGCETIAKLLQKCPDTVCGFSSFKWAQIAAALETQRNNGCITLAQHLKQRVEAALRHTTSGSLQANASCVACYGSFFSFWISDSASLMKRSRRLPCGSFSFT